MAAQDDLITAALAAAGESITYTPRTGDARAITAFVRRELPKELMKGTNAPLLTITVKNSATDGISTAEVDTGGDQVSVAVRVGESAQDRRIGKPLEQNSGFVKYEVR